MDEGPVLRRRRLGGELKRCREAAGLTQEAVSRHFEWHTAKVTRIETARVAVTPRDVKDLLSLYGVSDRPYRESLASLARSARERPWWSEYRDVMRTTFVGLEAGATAIRSWEPAVVPGLLQTAGYTRSLLGAALPSEPAEAIERRVELRRARQRRLTGHRPLRLDIVIDESVLHRVVGGDAVRAGQLARLHEAAELPHVTVRVLPYAAGAHQLLSGPVAVLEFGGRSDPDVVFREGPPDEVEDRPVAVGRVREALDEVRARALDARASSELIRGLARPTSS